MKKQHVSCRAKQSFYVDEFEALISINDIMCIRFGDGYVNLIFDNLIQLEVTLEEFEKNVKPYLEIVNKPNSSTSDYPDFNTQRKIT